MKRPNMCRRFVVWCDPAGRFTVDSPGENPNEPRIIGRPPAQWREVARVTLPRRIATGEAMTRENVHGAYRAVLRILGDAA